MLVVEVGRANVPSAWKNISGEVGALELGKSVSGEILAKDVVRVLKVWLPCLLILLAPKAARLG